MFLDVIRFLLAILIAFLFGKLITKTKLPAILGWLIAGMIVGPHAIGLVDQRMLDFIWYEDIIHVLECVVGLLIGTELVWNKIKKSGKQIIITTLFQSLSAFALVTIVFGIVFYFAHIPLYLAVIFGGIALATAPAPALSIVREFKTKGPVTDALIPMAALDDIVAVVIFFTTISFISSNLSGNKLPFYMILLVILIPIIIGIVVGFLTGMILKKEKDISIRSIIILIVGIVISATIGFIFNTKILPKPVLNFMLIGMAFSAVFANMITEERLEQLMKKFNPILGISMIIVILNLGMPLNYHLILGAGIYTLIYIVSRGLGKYTGAYVGAKVTKMPESVQKYLGLTLLPHSGVSLVFTGIAVSTLQGTVPECAQIIQGTIAAAAVINEIIAVIIAKQAFKFAKELNS